MEPNHPINILDLEGFDKKYKKGFNKEDMYEDAFGKIYANKTKINLMFPYIKLSTKYHYLRLHD